MPPVRTAPLGLAIAAVMAGLGLYIGGRLLTGDGPPLTGTRALDAAFAVFFVLRGAVQAGRWRRATQPD